MRTRKMRLISFVLALAMMLAIAPVSAFAETSATELTVSVSKVGENDKCALELAVSELGKTPEELAQVTTLDLDTAEGIMLTRDDIEYLKKTFTAIQTLDLTDADFFDNQGDGKNNPKWFHPWKGNTADIEHQFPDCAFTNYNGPLNTVIFGSKIKSVGAYAFSGCSSLTNVEFVNSTLEAIDQDAFRNTQLSAVEIPDTVSFMGYGVFYGTQLTSVVLPDALKKLYYCTFGNCSELVSVDLNSIEEIGGMPHFASQNAVFYNCAKLKYIKLPKTLKELGGQYTHVFYGCTVVVDATEISDMQVGPKAFEGSNALVYLPKEAAAQMSASNHMAIAITNGGTFKGTDTFTTEKLATPVKDGYRFEGWYDNADFTGSAVTAPENGKTYYAKWYKYNAEVDTEEKTDDTKSNYIGSPTDIAVDVKAEAVDVSSIAKADLIFDDIDAVEKVEVNGKELDKPYTNILLNPNAEQGIALMDMVPVTKEPVILRLTFKKPGDHLLKIVLKDKANNVICSQDTTVKVVEKPILTFSDDCIVKVNGDEVKTGAEVEAGAKVTVNLAKDVDNGMKFGSYVIDPIPDDLKVDGTTATFTMPEKNVDVKVRLETADTEDDSWDAATVVTGVAIGAGAAVLTYHIGTELYAEQVLGKGVAVPKTREDVALKAWELAGKPAVELNGEPLSETTQAEKWAVESGLMQNVDGSFNGTKKMNKLKALRVLDKAQKLGNQ